MAEKLVPPRDFEAGTAYEVRRAARDHRCDGYSASGYRVIKRGERYLLVTMFPSSSDYNFVKSGSWEPLDRPVRMRVCLDDAPRWVHEQLAARASSDSGRGDTAPSSPATDDGKTR